MNTMIENLTGLFDDGNIAQVVHAMQESYEVAKAQSIVLPEIETLNDKNRWQNKLTIFEGSFFKTVETEKPDLQIVLNALGHLQRLYERRGIMPNRHDRGKYHMLEVLSQFGCFVEIVFAPPVPVVEEEKIQHKEEEQ